MPRVLILPLTLCDMAARSKRWPERLQKGDFQGLVPMLRPEVTRNRNRRRYLVAARSLSSLYFRHVVRRTLSQLSIKPEDTLVDEDVVVRATGLPPGHKVTILAQLEENKQRFASYAHYVAKSDGSVDVDKDPSYGGLFSGIEPMGHFWSMEQEEGQREGLRLVKRDVGQPYRVLFSLLDGHRTWEDINTNPPSPLCTRLCFRRYQALGVKRVRVADGRIRGAFFVPAGSGPHPGLIEFFGSAGGLMDFRGALLASRGIATLCLAFFDYPELPQTLEDVEFGYFEEAADWMTSHKEVMPGGIGVLGVSKGGELAMLMGIHCPQVKAVVSIGGPPHLTFTDLKMGAAHSLPGVPLDESRITHRDGAIVTKNAFPYEDHHLFLYDQMNAKCLLLLGEDDQIYDPTHQQRIIASLDPEHRSKFKVICYPGAGHLIEPPHCPVCLQSWHKGVGRMTLWGGEKKCHADAQVHAWQELLAFLRENLPTAKP